MFSILLTLLIVVAVIMVAVILLQKSEGNGISGSQAAAMFGGALTGRSAGNFFTKLTAWLATIFFIVSAVLAVVVSKQGANVNRSEIREELIKGGEAAAPAAPAAESAPIPEMPEVPDVPDVPEN